MSSFDITQYEFEETSIKKKIKSAIEAMLFASGEPLALKDLSTHLEIGSKVIEQIISEMIEEYKAEDRGITLISINGSYQLVTKAENSDYIQKLLKKNRRQSLSQASIESLAIIAYKQPITRIDIDEIRGVKSESALQKLVEKNLKELPSLDLYKEDEEVDNSLDIINKAINEIEEVASEKEEE